MIVGRQMNSIKHTPLAVLLAPLVDLVLFIEQGQYLVIPVEKDWNPWFDIPGYIWLEGPGAPIRIKEFYCIDPIIRCKSITIISIKSISSNHEDSLATKAHASMVSSACDK